jgi:pyruvate formate lyase activating enzyme
MSDNKRRIEVIVDEAKKQQSVSLNVHSVESLGTFDGPGIRFVLFLQGCPMRCLYCANPDTMKYQGGERQSIEDLYKQIERLKPYFSNGGGVTASGGSHAVRRSI